MAVSAEVSGAVPVNNFPSFKEATDVDLRSIIDGEVNCFEKINNLRNFFIKFQPFCASREIQ